MDDAERRFERELGWVREDLNEATYSFFVLMEINNCAAENVDILRKLQRHPTFWNAIRGAMLTSFIIALARIFDDGADAHSMHKLVVSCIKNPMLFSRDSLLYRKVRGLKMDASAANAFVAEAFEPSAEDLRVLHKQVSKCRKLFEPTYKLIRSHIIAHRILREEQEISDLFGRTQIADIEKMLYWLHDLIECIWHLYYNGARPQLGEREHDYPLRIKETVRAVLSSLT